MPMRCPRPYCKGWVTVEPVLNERGLVDGVEARCLMCGRAAPVVLAAKDAAA